MRYISAFALVVFLVGLAGCLSAERQERVNSLGRQNEELAAESAALAVELSSLVEKAKAGTITAEELAMAVGRVNIQIARVNAQMAKNIEEIKAIKAEGGFWAAVWGFVGMFGRTALHGAAKYIPATGWWAVVQGFLGLLLGGSATAKKEPSKA